MSNKRKRIQSNLTDFKKVLSVLPCTNAVPCIKSLKSIEKRFAQRLTVTDNSFALDALVLPNELCVLVMKNPIIGADKVVFNAEFYPVVQTTGKRKKGCRTVNPGDVICTTVIGDVVQNYITPVGGRMIEYNECILQQPSLLGTDPSGVGHVAIILPETEIPSIFTDTPDYDSLLAKTKLKRHCVVNKICFEWAKGLCNRGDTCKFAHSHPEGDTSWDTNNNS